MNTKEYYEMLKTIPKEDRERLGLTYEYLNKAMSQEILMSQEYLRKRFKALERGSCLQFNSYSADLGGWFGSLPDRLKYGHY